MTKMSRPNAGSSAKDDKAADASGGTVTITALANLQLKDGTVLNELEADDLPESEAMDLIARKLAEDGEENAIRRRTPGKPAKEAEA